MYHKERVGDSEVIYPDKDLKQLLKEVILQNKMILEMNAEIIDTFAKTEMITTKIEYDSSEANQAIRNFLRQESGNA